DVPGAGPAGELIVRRVYGVGGAGIVNRHRAGRSWAWPSGDWGSLPVQGGIEAAFRAELDQAADREAESERIRRMLAPVSAPLRTGGRLRRPGLDRPGGLAAAAGRVGAGRLRGPARPARPSVLRPPPLAIRPCPSSP